MQSVPLIEADHQSLSAYLGRAQKAISDLYPAPEKIVAEIAGIKYHKQHAFIELAEYNNDKNRTLKAKVQAIIFKSNKRIIANFEKEVKRNLETGMKVLVDVKTSLTEQRGLSVEIVGIDHKYTIGDMALLVEEIRKTLVDQKLFSRNKELPEPKDFFRLAVISPASSAGLEDFKKKLEDIPDQVCKKIERTCLFQSDKAGDEIAREIVLLNRQQEPLDAILIIFWSQVVGLDGSHLFVTAIRDLSNAVDALIGGIGD